jgi:hypothetical protein
MTGAPPPTLFVGVVAELAALGVKLTARAGEYVVNFRDGTEATAYVTDDLADAILHGHALARSIAADRSPAAGKPARGTRRRRPLRMTPKAHNRRMRKKHMRRLLARAKRAKSSPSHDTR